MTDGQQRANPALPFLAQNLQTPGAEGAPPGLDPARSQKGRGTRAIGQPIPFITHGLHGCGARPRPVAPALRIHARFRVRCGAQFAAEPALRVLLTRRRAVNRRLEPRAASHTTSLARSRAGETPAGVGWRWKRRICALIRCTRSAWRLSRLRKVMESDTEARGPF